jgi:uncharacterized protein (TIGR02466 family)
MTEQILEIFPSPVLVTDLSQVLDMSDIKKRCMQVIGTLDHQCGHDLVEDGVSSFNTDKPVITNPLVSDLKHIIMMYVKQLESAMGLYPLMFSNSWINVMPKDSRVGQHIHPYSVISGAFYLDASEGSGEFVIENPLYNQQMALMSQDETPYSKVYENIPVKTGMLILFPSYLRHHVTQNKYEGRTVLSVNTTYDPRYSTNSPENL